MKKNGTTYNGEKHVKVTCESTGLKINGKMIWEDANGNWYELENGSRFMMGIAGRSANWFKLLDKEVCKEILGI